jgi:hypothetical protein
MSSSPAPAGTAKIWPCPGVERMSVQMVLKSFLVGTGLVTHVGVGGVAPDVGGLVANAATPSAPRAEIAAPVIRVMRPVELTELPHQIVERRAL